DLPGRQSARQEGGGGGCIMAVRDEIDVVARLEDGAPARGHELPVAQHRGDDDVAWQGQVGDARPDGPAVLPYEDVRDRGAYGSVAPELEAQGAARRLLDGQAEALRQRPHGEALYDGAHDDDDEDDVEDVLGAGDAEPQRDNREDDGHRAL